MGLKTIFLNQSHRNDNKPSMDFDDFKNAIAEYNSEIKKAIKPLKESVSAVDNSLQYTMGYQRAISDVTKTLFPE